MTRHRTPYRLPPTTERLLRLSLLALLGLLAAALLVAIGIFAAVAFFSR